MTTTTKHGTLVGLAIAVLVAFVGALGQMVTQTALGSVKVQEISFINQSGYTTNAKAYVPSSATADAPAHAVVVTHGGNDDKELMSRYALELAHRGYVAVAIDMYGHGGSSWLPNSEWLTAGRGVYDMVRHVVTWPNVDPESVSLLGYSRGGVASGEALKLDNEELGVVKNVFLIYTDPTYYNAEAQFVDVYGARNVSVVADLYDEFFFTMKGEVGGTYSNDKNRFLTILSSPVDYINTPIAQSFPSLRH